MRLSYKWLCEYLPVDPRLSKDLQPEALGNILTSLGLEVESLESFEEIKAGMEGLIVGEVLSVEKHPDADKLKITRVNAGSDTALQIVCGASNVAAGQKVIVAPAGATIYPKTGEPLTLRKAKIRGQESEGMICAGDEIGLNDDHSGILVLPPDSQVGTPVADIFKPYRDHIYEIGLTPNRMDAMSHLGVAKDVCAWLTYHRHEVALRSPLAADQPSDAGVYPPPIEVTIRNPESCKRYSGVVMTGITVTDSPKWLKEKLLAIGLNPINNVVDITNYILHETGQPLHAFDLDAITGNKIVVQNATEGSTFKTLDGKDRQLAASDLLICNASEGMCIAGVYGGAKSGVTETTKQIFLESAWFSPDTIRRTALHHNLRTDAATRFEKGTDISNTLVVLKRAAALMAEVTGGAISGDFVDEYPIRQPKTRINFSFDYLQKLSGKKYEAESVAKILRSLGFDISAQTSSGLIVHVPYSKPDIILPADLVEEVMRVDGLDNIEIPKTIRSAPSVEKNSLKYSVKEKAAGYLTGLGFSEMFNNSITNSAFYSEEVVASSVRMINSLSSELDIMRPDMLQGGLQAISHNINRKNTDLLLFEFGKTYGVSGNNSYTERERLALFATGNRNAQSWRHAPVKTDLFFLKGVLQQLLASIGFRKLSFRSVEQPGLATAAELFVDHKIAGVIGQVNAPLTRGLKQPVFYADLDWDLLGRQATAQLTYREIPKYPAMVRDLALVVDKNVSYNQIETIALSGKINDLQSVRLFDIFENEKLGGGKKSMACSFVFSNDQKTLTDKEVDGYLQQLMNSYENELGAEIRK